MTAITVRVPEYEGKEEAVTFITKLAKSLELKVNKIVGNGPQFEIFDYNGVMKARSRNGELLVTGDESAIEQFVEDMRKMAD